MKIEIKYLSSENHKSVCEKLMFLKLPSSLVGFWQLQSFNSAITLKD